jgi:hypothetical protein
MKKIFTLITLVSLFVMGFASKALAQYPASSYAYAAVSGTYTDITGVTGLTVLPSAFYGDDNLSGNIPIGFTFNYCGVDYTQLKACTNGFLSFNTPTTNQWTNTLANLTANSIKPALLPLWDDLGGTGGTASYVTTGTAPNRKFTIQFKNWQWYVGNNNTISFQVMLYETTNVIEYQYKQESGALGGFSESATIGIADGTATPTYLTLNNSLATATASSTTFTTSINTKPPEGQLYRFTPPANCATTTGFPTAATTTVSPTTLCLSGNVTLTYTPATAMPATTGVTYKWQSAPATTGPFTDIPGAVTTLPTYTTTTPVTTATCYRCVLLCNGSSTIMTATPSVVVVVNNPGVPTVTGATRCGPGSVTLSATPPSGATVNWYANAAGGAPLFSGNAYTTNYLPTTTTFYASAASGSSAASGWVGTGTTISSQPSPIYTLFYAQKSQFIITAAEMIASGFGAGTINSMGIDVVGNTGTPLSSFTIKMGTTSLTAITALQPAPANQVYTTAVYNPVANSVNTFTFTTPFSWDGVSNIIIETCFNNTSWTTGHTVKTSTTSYSSSFVAYDDVSTFCANPTTGSTGSYNSRPNFQFGMTLGCNGARQPVIATITPSPAVTKAFTPVVCNNSTSAFVLNSSPMTNYSNYAWTPIADLYGNAAATTAYALGANAPTVYFKSSTVGPHTFYMFASNPTPTGCTFADTLSVWVQPTGVVIKGFPDTLCAPSGSTTLKLVPETGYAPNTIQWFQSADGNTYTPISGATSAVYTTPTITSSTYYKAFIKGTIDTCQIPVKLVVVANPQLISYSDSFNCGPGIVTLRAASGGNSNVRWYTSATANQPVGSGNIFTTPYLGTTTNYYVEAGTGTVQPAPTFIGSGTSSDWWGYLPYFGYYYANKVQWLVTAAEMQAAGFGQGLITQMGFDVVTNSGTPSVKNLTYSMKNITGGLTTWQTNMQQVWTAAAYTPTANATNVHTFQSAFFWDGVSNIVVQECNSNTTASFAFSTVKYNTTLPNSCIYNYASGSATPTNCSAPSGMSSTSTRPNIRFTMTGGCASPRQMVVANIYPKPVIDLGTDINRCVDAGASIVLDAGVQPNSPQFLWDNNTTLQVRAVSSSGSYSVKVTNSYTCQNSDTITVILRQNPVSELGNDTTVCNGVNLVLDPGNDGIQYFWSNGLTTRTVTVNSPGQYRVFITNAAGCVVSDTINVNMQGQLPTIQDIQITNNGQFTFNFNAVNPQNVIGYDWDFGDNTPHSYMANPQHTYPDAGNYVVVLRLSSTCGFFSDSTSAHIVGINQINITNDELSVYPNPSTGTATILNKGTLSMEKVEIFNVLGQVVYRAKADSKDKHVLNVNQLASGIYTVEVYTNKGNVSRKLEIIK